MLQWLRISAARHSKSRQACGHGRRAESRESHRRIHDMTKSRHPSGNPEDLLSRRSVLRMGVGGLGLSLTGLLHARAVARPIESLGLPPLKACVIVFYY